MANEELFEWILDKHPLEAVTDEMHAFGIHKGDIVLVGLFDALRDGDLIVYRDRVDRDVRHVGRLEIRRGRRIWAEHAGPNFVRYWTPDIPEVDVVGVVHGVIRRYADEQR